MRPGGAALVRRTSQAALVLAASCSLPSSEALAQRARPVMRDFMGLCVHTVLFDAEAYTSIVRRVRDYHGVQWDLGEDTDHQPAWPLARNGVNWDQLYGGWTDLGYEVLVSLMFDSLPPETWPDLATDAQAYGRSFAAYFGSTGQGTVSAVEIGNEPTQWDDAQYRALFESAAQGVRAGDPAMRIATCAAQAGPSDTYSKGLDSLAGLESLYDIINVHAYALVDGWPTWRRSYPEDPGIDFLDRLRAIIAWRDANAPGKEIWLTEFGWDASTQEPDPDGGFAQWEDVSDLEQARYIVRAWLVFAAMDLDRAYLYWFDDDDAPQLHGSSGLTRGGVPKPSFHAVAHLQATLGALRFDRAVQQEEGQAYVYAFVDPANPDREVWAAWSPTGADREVAVTLAIEGWRLDGAERMPAEGGPAPSAAVEILPEGARFLVGESPTYLWLTRAPSDVGGSEAGADEGGEGDEGGGDEGEGQAGGEQGAGQQGGEGPGGDAVDPGDAGVGDTGDSPPGGADPAPGDPTPGDSAEGPSGSAGGGSEDGCATSPRSAVPRVLRWWGLALGLRRAPAASHRVRP